MPPQRTLAIYDCLELYDAAISQLFDAVSTSAQSSAQQATLDGAIDAIITQNSDLSDALDEVYQHARNSQKISSLKRESKELDDKLNAIVSVLSTTQQSLLASSRQEEEEEEVRVRKVDYKTLLAYAARIAKFTNSSPSSAQSAEANSKSLWPTEDMMRRSMTSHQTSGITNGHNTQIQMDTQSASTLIVDGGPIGAAIAQDPTSKQVYGADDDDEEVRRRRSQGSMDHVATLATTNGSAMALDLDLFDPDEDD